VIRRMSKPAENLPDDSAVLKPMIAELQAENAKIAATLRVHDQLVQALRLRIAKLQKLAFGKSSEKIEREIPSRDIASRQRRACSTTQYKGVLAARRNTKACLQHDAIPCPVARQGHAERDPERGQWSSWNWRSKTCWLR
jgi:hypothetical protein